MREEKREKTPRNVLLPAGVNFRVKEEDNGWTWMLKMEGRKLASGIATSEKEAWTLLKGKMGEVLVPAGRSRAARAAKRQKLRSWLERRVYVVAHVLSGVVAGEKAGDIINAAEKAERRLQRADKERCGFAWPIPEHPLAKLPTEVARLVLELMRELGLDNPKAAQRWGTEHLGTQWATPEQDDDVQVVRAPKAPKLKTKRGEMPLDYDPDATDLEG